MTFFALQMMAGGMPESTRTSEITAKNAKRIVQLRWSEKHENARSVQKVARVVYAA